MSTVPDEGEELRCACGALIARWLADGVELRCRRCRRRIFLRYPETIGPRQRPRLDIET